MPDKAKAGGGFYFFFQLRIKFKSKHFPRLLLTLTDNNSLIILDIKNEDENKTENINNINKKLLLSDVIGSNWNTTDYINQKVKNIMWNTDRKFDNYYQ